MIELIKAYDPKLQNHHTVELLIQQRVVQLLQENLNTIKQALELTEDKEKRTKVAAMNLLLRQVEQGFKQTKLAALPWDTN